MTATTPAPTTPAPPRPPSWFRRHKIWTLILAVVPFALIGGIASGLASQPSAAPKTSTTAPPAQAPPPGQTTPTTPAPPSAPDTFGLPIGSTITMTDSTSGANWDVTLNSVRAFAPGQYDSPAPVGQHYIIIDVTYSATAGQVDANEWDWTAKDPTGLVSQVQTVTSPNSLSATTIVAGNKLRGTVVLAVANGSGGTVVYSAGMSERASWAFTAA